MEEIPVKYDHFFSLKTIHRDHNMKYVGHIYVVKKW